MGWITHNLSWLIGCPSSSKFNQLAIDDDLLENSTQPRNPSECFAGYLENRQKKRLKAFQRAPRFLLSVHYPTEFPLSSEQGRQKPTCLSQETETVERHQESGVFPLRGTATRQSKHLRHQSAIPSGANFG